MMKKSGFTLVEILVVLAIIGLLAVILIPTVSSVLAKGRRTQCLNNLHSLGVAAASYAGEHRGRLPKIGSGGDYESYSAMIKDWIADQFIGSLDVLVCPLDTGRKVCDDASSFDSHAHCSYVYFTGYNLNKAEGRLAQLPLFCDRARAGGDAPLGDSDNHGASWRNVVYLDGHTVGLGTAADANAVVKVDYPGVALAE